MLELQSRTQVLEAMRLTRGYGLDCAIATKYSLDLLTLLAAPLAFTLFDWEDNEGRPLAEPIAVLHAMRQYADRYCVLPGRSDHDPKADEPLYAHPEDSMIEAATSSPNGAFSPKVWVLRFASASQPVRYRVFV